MTKRIPSHWHRRLGVPGALFATMLLAACATDEDLACKSGYCAGAVCAEKLANDELCNRDAMCESDFCFTLAPEIPMRCTPKLEDLQPCDSITAVGCDSHHCVQVPGICGILTLNEKCDPSW